MTRHYWQDLKTTTYSWLAHEGPRLAAALSLYSLLSLSPLVILSIEMAALVFGRPAAQYAITNEVRELMGSPGARTVQTVIQYGAAPGGHGLASAIGIAVLLFGASSVFGELQSGMNKIWDVQSSRQAGVLIWLKSRLVSFALVLGFGFLLLVSLVFSAALAAFGKFFSSHLPFPSGLLIAANDLLSFVGILILIALIFRYVPDVRLGWKEVWPGALATALLFTGGKTLLGLYLGRAAVGSTYGAAGSLVVVIIWVYYSAMIFYFGAEYTRVRAQGSGQRAHLLAARTGDTGATRAPAPR